MSQITAIVCIGPKGLIGTPKNIMPWYSRKDFFHFVHHTKHKPCIFGANTFFNMPLHPLPNRLNVVVSSRYHKITRGEYLCAPNVQDALKHLKDYPEIMICGGSKLYSYCFDYNYLDRFILTTLYSPELKQIATNKDNIFLPEYILNDLEQNWIKSEILYDNVPAFPHNSDAGLNIRFWNYQKSR